MSHRYRRTYPLDDRDGNRGTAAELPAGRWPLPDHELGYHRPAFLIPTFLARALYFCDADVHFTSCWYFFRDVLLNIELRMSYLGGDVSPSSDIWPDVEYARSQRASCGQLVKDSQNRRRPLAMHRHRTCRRGEPSIKRR